MTGLYQSRVATDLPNPITHLFKVTAYPVSGDPFPVDIDGNSLSVTFSEDWSPYVQARMNAVVPALESQMDALDPRKLCRLVVEAGYRYQDYVTDLKPLCNLMLNDRRVSRPDNLMPLDASSDEIRAQDRKRTDASTVPIFTGINGVIRWVLGWAMYPEVPVVLSGVDESYAASRIKDLDLEIGSDWWGLLADVANRSGMWIHCDENRVWRIRSRAAIGPSVLNLKVGEGGTLLQTDSSLSREEWANYCIIKYSFTQKKPTAEDPNATVAKTIYGRAKVSGGPFSVDSVGYKMHYETRTFGVDQSGAYFAATSVLRNLVSRGRVLNLTAAAAYWLRPGHTITVQLTTGAVHTVLVVSVTFNPAEGTMSVKTRYPETATITQGE